MRTRTTRSATSPPWLAILSPAPVSKARSSPFSDVAIAATSEKGDDLAFETGAGDKIASQGGEVAERVVRVRIIHDHRKGLAAIHALEAAGNAGEVEDSFCDRLGGTIAGNPGGRSCEHVV